VKTDLVRNLEEQRKTLESRYQDLQRKLDDQRKAFDEERRDLQRKIDDHRKVMDEERRELLTRVQTLSERMATVEGKDIQYWPPRASPTVTKSNAACGVAKNPLRRKRR